MTDHSFATPFLATLTSSSLTLSKQKSLNQDYLLHKRTAGVYMNPKPRLPNTKERRERMNRRMTLIIGMECKDCLLLCADREESTGYGGKRSVSKIHDAQGNGWAMGIATAGSGTVGDLAAMRIIAMARKQKDFAANPEPLLSNALSEIYEKYIFPRDERRQGERAISLVIGIQGDDGKAFIFKTADEMVNPHSHYACAGAGQDVAYYFLDRLYDETLVTGKEAQMLMAFIVREAKSAVGGVGKESEFLQLFHGKPHAGLTQRILTGESFDWNEIPKLSDCFNQFWKRSKPSTAEK